MSNSDVSSSAFPTGCWTSPTSMLHLRCMHGPEFAVVGCGRVQKLPESASLDRSREGEELDALKF